MTAFRKIISIFLLFGILSNCLNYWVLSASYTFNKAYISSVLCTNKDKPELHCEGKCFMDIKLKELEQKNKQDQENLKRSVEFFEQKCTLLPQPFSLAILSTENAICLAKKPIAIDLAIFHPPA